MRRNLCLVAALSGAVFGASVAHAQAVISIDPTSQSVAAGTDFTVDVNISNVSDLYAYQFDLTFDPCVFQAVSSTEGAFLPQGGATFFIPGTNDNVGGTVSATAGTLLTAVNGVSGSGELVAFTFDALKAGTSSFSVANDTLLDSNLSMIAHTTTAGSATVTSGVVQAPEIDSTSTATALTLLFGGLAVLRGRRAR